MSAGHQLTTVESIARFMYAGNATLTLRSTRTGVRYTYRVSLADPLASRPAWFVSLLGGPDNVEDFRYMGLLNVGFAFRTTSKSKISTEAGSFIAWTWFLRQLRNEAVKLNQLEVWHEGTCGRCGRKLTVPESIELGIGPDCAEAMGL